MVVQWFVNVIRSVVTAVMDLARRNVAVVNVPQAVQDLNEHNAMWVLFCVIFLNAYTKNATFIFTISLANVD